MSGVVKAGSSPAFASGGLTGYQFDSLEGSEFDVYLMDVHGGHEKCVISKSVTRLYYVIAGRGTFYIGGEAHAVAAGCVVEVRPGVEYCYSGRMKVLLVSRPRWAPGNEVETRDNPHMAHGGAARRIESKVRSGVRRLRHYVFGQAPRGVR